MDRHQADPQHIPGQHHDEVVRAAQFGQQFGMTGIIVPGPMHGLLADRRGNHGRHLAIQTEPGRRTDVAENRIAGRCRRLAVAQISFGQPRERSRANAPCGADSASSGVIQFLQR